MAYDDNYIDAVTMQDACPADPGDTPGMNPDCKFIAPGEDITVFNTNRPSLQLAINCDILKTPLDSQVAVTQVGALLAFSGSLITINPTGGAGDISFTGHLYMGNVTYAPPSQERYDTLFQLLDENYNEVIVDGVEVKITGTAPIAIGTGWYNAGVVTLTLNKAVPSGNYRLAYARNSTLATLPDDALIRADIRGLHESAAESQRRAYIVCSPTADLPADFIGPDSLFDAISSLSVVGGGTIFVRTGDYEPTVNITVPNNISIIGEGEATVTINLAASGVLFTVSGNDVMMRNILIDGDAGVAVTWSGDRGRVEHCRLQGGGFVLSGCDGMVISNLYMHDNDDMYVDVTNCTALSIDGLDIAYNAASVGKGLILNSGCVGFSIRGSKIVTNCTNPTAPGDGSALHVTGGGLHGSFDGCTFSSKSSVVYSASTLQLANVVFNGCKFEMLAGLAAAAQDVPFDFRASSTHGRLELNECQITSLCTTWITQHNGKNFIRLQNVDAVGLELYLPSEAAPNDVNFIEFSRGCIDNIHIGLAAEDATGGGADGILRIGTGGVIRNLVWDTISGLHSIPLVYLGGDTSNRRATIDGAKITTSGTFYITGVGGMIRADDYAVVREVRYDANIDVAQVCSCVISAMGDESTVEECHLFNSQVAAQWQYVVYSYGDLTDVRVEKNFIDYESDNAPFRAIYIQGANFPGPGNNYSGGWTRGSVSRNTVEIGEAEGDGAGVATKCHFSAGSNAVFSRFDHNVMSARSETANSGSEHYMNVLAADIGVIPHTGNAGGNTTYGNILVDKTNPHVGLEPDINLSGGATAPPGHTDTVAVQFT